MGPESLFGSNVGANGEELAVEHPDLDSGDGPRLLGGDVHASSRGAGSPHVPDPPVPGKAEPSAPTEQRAAIHADPERGQGDGLWSSIEMIRSRLGAVAGAVLERLRLVGRGRGARFLEQHALPLMVFVAVALFVHRRSIQGLGVFLNGDLVRPLDLGMYQGYYTPMWNDAGSYSTLSRLPTALPLVPAIYFANLLGMDSTQFLKVEFVAIFALLGISMFYAVRYLMREHGYPGGPTTTIAAILGGLAYSCNSFVISNVIHPIMVAALVFAPLLLLALYLGMKRGSLFVIAVAGLIWCVMCMALHWMVYGIVFTVFILSYFLVGDILASRGHTPRELAKQWARHVALFGVFILVFVLFSMYWLLPGYMMGSTSRFAYIISYENLDMNYLDVNVWDVLSLDAHQFSTPYVYGTNDPLLSSTTATVVLAEMGLVLFVIAMAGLLFRRGRGLKVMLLCLTVAALVQVTMITYWPDAGLWFVSKAPMHSVYGWAFRTPKMIQLLFLAISILVAFSVRDLLAWVERWRLPRWKERASQVGIVGIVLTLIMVPNWPLGTGDFNGNLSTSELPPEFKEVFSWLDGQEGDFKVLWVPDYNNGQVDWNKGLRTTKNLIALSSPKDTYYFEDRNQQPSGYGIYFVESLFAPEHVSPLIFGNSTVGLGSILYPMGIKYVIFHDDNATALGNESKILAGLQRQRDLSLVKQVGMLYVFENLYHPEGFGRDVYGVDRETLVFGGLSALGTLHSMPGFDSSRVLPIYAEQTHLDLASFEGRVDAIVFDGEANLERMALAFLDEDYFLVPFDAAIHTDRAATIWSKKHIEDTGRPLLSKQSMDSSKDWAYGSDLVYTFGEGTPVPGAVPEPRPVFRFNFDNGTGPMDLNLSSRTVAITTSNRSTEGNHSLKGALEAVPGDDRTFTTLTQHMPMAAVHGTYRISADLSARNANKIQVRVRFFDADGKMVAKVFLMTLTGDFDFTRFSMDVHLPSTVRSMDLAVLAERPTSSTTLWWLDNVTIDLMVNRIEPNRLDIPLTTSSSGAHKVFVRALRGANGGVLGVSIDGDRIGELQTRGLPSGLTWFDAGNVTLAQGSHTLSVDNIEGFNELNVIAVVPAAVWEEHLARVSAMADRAIIVQTTEAECSLMGKGTSKLSGLPGVASNGEALNVAPGGAMSVPVNVVGDLNTSILVRLLDPPANGSIRIALEGFSWSFNASALGPDGWITIPGVPLEAGQHVLTLEVVPEHPLVFAEGFDGAPGQVWDGWCNWTLVRPKWNLTMDVDADGGTGGSMRQTTNLSVPNLFFSMMHSQDIAVDSPLELTLSVLARSENANASQVRVMGLNGTSMQWDQLAITALLKGDTDWKRYTKDFEVPADYKLLRVVLNAGTVMDPARGNSTLWYDDVTLVENVEHGNATLDIVHVISGASLDELGNVFGDACAPIVEYVGRPGINQLEVQVNATGPVTIVLREAYDDMWVLRDSEGRTYRSVPVAGMLNGFLVNGTGNKTYTIEFIPQAMFEGGMAVTLTAIGALGASSVVLYHRRKTAKSSTGRRSPTDIRRGRTTPGIACPAGSSGSGLQVRAVGTPRPDLSIVIPAYNEEDRIGRTLGDYLRHFEAIYGERFEMVVITDGCVDRTCEVIASVGSPRLRHFDHPKRLGKGGAILRGFKHSRGQVICFVDADGSTPPDQLELLIGTLEDTGCDAVIGSRYNNGGTAGRRLPLSRRLASRCFNIMVRALFQLPYSDTQCGAKVFRREAAEEVSEGLELTDWAFDVNLLYNARLHGLDVREVGIRWEDTDGSKLRMKRVVPKMFMSIIRLRLLHSGLKPLVQNRLARAVAGRIYGRSGASK